MKILLMCKGPGAKLLNQEEFLNSDIIAWANIPVFENNALEIPKKVDILYIRDKSFYDELPKEKKNEIDNITINEIISINSRFKKMGNKNISKTIRSNSVGKFNGSTGLNAFVDLVSRKPKELTVAGLDLFQEGLPLYFFDFKYNLTGEKTKNNLENEFLNDGNKILEKTIHEPEKSVNVIYDKVLSTPDTFFTFYTTNKNVENKLKNLPNVKIITS